MPSPYRAIFAAPGATAFSAAGLVGRLPLAMTGVGVLAMISELTGRYRLAGLVAATIALAAAAIGPRISRLVDRHGQTRVLRPATLVSVASGTGLILCATAEAPVWTLFLFAVGTGCVPSVGSMVRARWAAIYRDRKELHTAYAWEAIVDEICFIAGPPLAIGLSTGWFPAAGPVLAALFLLVGVFWLTAQKATEPVPAPREEHTPGSALASRALQVLVVTFVATGAVFGSVEVVSVAFAEEQGNKAASSAALAIYAAGSCLAGLVFGLLRPKGSPARRWLLGVCVMAVSLVPLQLVGNLVALCAVLFFAGLAIAPTMVTTMALVASHVPGTKLTEGMTWVSTGLAVGVALGSGAAGIAIDEWGARTAYAVPGVAGALAAVVAFLGYRRLTEPVPTREGQPVDEHDQQGERDTRLA
ncbi:MFS transporter [Streptomyces sp. NPDC020875]|uniref:MFS transporter n=1 Tax=Streptomyces sp. NPDC020875 TaxID=3154898 RepID=UPI0033C1C29C